MTFTYTPSSATDITRVRFHIGDVDSSAAIFTDEEITFQISETGDWQHCVIACLESIIARSSATPNFTADWLTVNNNSALQYYSKLLDRKRQEFGISGVVASTIYTYRPDSRQTSAPTFTDYDNDYDGDGF